MEARALILAAGAGTRMKSKKPKVAHELLSKPLIRWVIDAAHEAGIESLISVLGHGREQVIPLVENDTTVVVQPERRGTGDAVAVCKEALSGFDGPVAVLSGDCPLISPESIRALVAEQESSGAACVILTMHPENPFGYGRIVRAENGEVLRIVEQKDCTPEEAAIGECNAGFYCFDARSLFAALEQLDADNAQGEYYLTDVIKICRQAGKGVRALLAGDATECLGINSRAQLAEASKIMQRRINARHMAAGVTMTDPDLVWVGPDVSIAADTEILPLTFLMGSTSVGEDCVIGPNTRLTNTRVGSRCRLDETIAIDAQIDDGVSCGPRAYLRPGTHMREGSKAGTHVEIKNSTIGAGSKVPHLSYIGDAELGSGVNVGAGSITCNYDGFNKHHTSIGNDVFIGSDTMMVAPVSIGERAVVGAGSVITKDVSAGALALERSRQLEIAGYRKRKEEEQAKGQA